MQALACCSVCSSRAVERLIAAMEKRVGRNGHDTRSERHADCESRSRDDEASNDWRSLAMHLFDATSHLRTLGWIQAERTRVRLRRALARAWSDVLVGVAVLTAVACGVVLFATGLARTIEALMGGLPGLGTLAVGALLLGAAVLVLLARRSLVARDRLRRVRERFPDAERSDQ